MQFWKACQLWLKKGLFTMKQDTHEQNQPRPTSIPAGQAPRADFLGKSMKEDVLVVSNTPDPLIPEDLKTLNVDALEPLSLAHFTSPTATSRSVSEIATEFESAVSHLEDLFTGAEAHYQDWIKANEARLRVAAARDRKIEMDAAATKVSHLESELASASSVLSRRSAAVRSKLV